MGLVFDDVVGIVEIINCKDVKIQVCITNVSSCGSSSATQSA